jgi:hypothetical protein
MVDETLIAKALEVAGCHIHTIVGHVGIYRKEQPEYLDYCKRATERLLRWFVSRKRRGEVVTSQLMNEAGKRFLDEEETA